MPLTARADPADDLTSMSLEQLTQIKVYTASRHLEDQHQAPSAVTIISSEDISHYGWRTLADVLRSVRGFYTAYDRVYTYLGVRGFLRPGDYNSRILLLINGHRMNDNVYDSAQVGTEFPLDLSLVDHIEIVRGPSSSLFGSNAVFGVVNVITRRPSSETAIEVSADDSSFLGRTGRITTLLHQGRWSALLSGSLYRSDGQSDLFYPEFVNDNRGIAHNLDGDRYGHAFADLQYGDFRIQGLYSSRTKMIPTAPYDTDFNEDARATDDRAFIDVAYHHLFSGGTDLDARVYYDDYDSYGTGIFDGPVADTHFRGITEGYANWIGGEAVVGHQFGSQRVIGGADYDYSLRVDQRNFAVGQAPIASSNENPWLAAAYGEAELHLVPRLTIHAGGRLDWYDTFGHQLSPRLAFVFQPNARTSIKYIFGRAFRAPNAYESYYSDNMVIEAPATPLKPENITSHEIVLERSVTDWVRVTAEGFHNSLRNLIDTQPDPSTGLNQFVNIGHDLGEGLEFEIEAKRASGLAARASYTYANANDVISSSRLANSPLHTAKLNALIPLRRQFFAAPELLYSSSQESYQAFRVPSSFLVNFTLSTKPLWGGWEFSGSCYNLFDRTWFAPPGPELRESEVLQDGRTFRLKLTYRLNLRAPKKP